MDKGRQGVAAVLACVAIVMMAVVLSESETPSQTSGYQFLETPNLERPYAGSVGMRCGVGSWCRQGLMCIQGFCQRPYDYVNYPSQPCERSEQCAYGYSCLEGRCQFV